VAAALHCARHEVFYTRYNQQAVARTRLLAGKRAAPPSVLVEIRRLGLYELTHCYSTLLFLLTLLFLPLLVLPVMLLSLFVTFAPE
jgi:hypothetical protein